MTMKIFSGKLDVEDVTGTLKTINGIGKDTGSTIVLFDAAKIAGKPHIESAVMHAERSFAEGKNIARTLAMEILLYASGQRQCSLAPQFGLQAGQNQVYVLILDGDADIAEEKIRELIEESNEVTADTKTLMREFCITKEEIGVVGEDQIGELVIERVSMLDAWR